VIAESAKREILTIEDYTLFSLERSRDGLAMLAADAEACASAFTAEPGEYANRSLLGLMRHLRDFEVFEFEMRSILKLNSDAIRDDRGSLAEAEEDFRRSCNLVADALDRGNTEAIVSALRNGIVPAVGRVRELLPEVSRLVFDKYVGPEPKDG
jgi:hypothetical protein